MYQTPLSGTAPGSIFDPTQGSLYPYIKSKAVYVCPDDSSNQGNSYSYSQYLLSLPAGQTTCTAFISGVALNQITEPASVIAFNEEADGYAGSTDDGLTYPNAPYNNPTTTRHGGAGSVYAFCDGHAKYYRVDQVNPAATTGTPRYCL